MNGEIRASTGVEKSEKIREARLRWLGHVEKKAEDVVMRTWKWVDTVRSKLRWSDVIRKDMR